MSACVSCRRGFHSSCSGCDCTHEQEVVVDDERPSAKRQGRGYKRDAALKDQQSTGRKRAAKLYPLDRDADCEWANKAEAGGGVTIQGCGLREGTTVGKQLNIHHGPDYNTLNNDPDNVHRICTMCHSAWHRANDPTKDEAYLRLYGVHAGGKNLKSSKVLARDSVPTQDEIKKLLGLS